MHVRNFLHEVWVVGKLCANVGGQVFASTNIARKMHADLRDLVQKGLETPDEKFFEEIFDQSSAEDIGAKTVRKIETKNAV